ncbi:MAG: phytanoyl-CoA dioxygenase family protein [Alphaproteobacteria bacterium]
MAELQRFAADAPADHWLAAAAADGGVIVERLIPDAVRQAFLNQIRPHVQTARPGSTSDAARRRTFYGNNTKRFCGLAAKAPAFIDLLLHPALLAYAHRVLLKDDTEDVWLNTGQMMVVGPGEPAQRLHRDDDNWPALARMGFAASVSTMIALEDFTAENGATRVVPGSHGETPAFDPAASDDSVTQAVMPAGSVLFYSGRTVHGAGHNRTADTWRMGLHISYVSALIRPEENHALAVPLEVARTLPAAAQRMLGWASYVPKGKGGRLGLLDFEDSAVAVNKSLR